MCSGCLAAQSEEGREGKQPIGERAAARITAARNLGTWFARYKARWAEVFFGRFSDTVRTLLSDLVCCLVLSSSRRERKIREAAPCHFQVERRVAQPAGIVLSSMRARARTHARTHDGGGGWFCVEGTTLGAGKGGVGCDMRRMSSCMDASSSGSLECVPGCRARAVPLTMIDARYFQVPPAPAMHPCSPLEQAARCSEIAPAPVTSGRALGRQSAPPHRGRHDC